MENRESSNLGTLKTNPNVNVTLHPGTWQTREPEKTSPAPVPPPVWTRYIDSRLKQFCVR